MVDSSGAFDLDGYLCERYRNAIDYYWKASRTNKRWYKVTRALTVILGALVTLVASLTTSEILQGNDAVGLWLALGTPLLAATLTIIAGFSQSFQWGSAWQNMVLTAQQLQKEYDRYLLTPEGERDYQAESERLNRFVIAETHGFFERLLGGMPRYRAEGADEDERP